VRNDAAPRCHLSGGARRSVWRIAWYQYDANPGMARVIANMIAYTDTAAIFVCGVAESCTRPIESFVVKHNLMQRTRGDTLNLQPTSGTYQVQANSG
jgi:hypothetical protein